MQKKYLIIFGGGVILIILLLVVFLRSSNQTDKTKNSTLAEISKQSAVEGAVPNIQSKLPEFIPTLDKVVDSTGKQLTFAQRRSMVAFAGNIAGLYQTFGYNDYNSVLTVAEYGTAEIKQSATMYISNLQNSIKPGYSQYAVADTKSTVALTFGATKQIYYATFLVDVYLISDPSNPKKIGQTVTEVGIASSGNDLRLASVNIEPFK